MTRASKSRWSTLLVPLCFATLLVSEETGPRAVLTATAHDFGTVRRGAKVEATIGIRNPGNADLVIAGMSMSAQGLVLKAPRTVPAGQEANLVLDLDTAAVMGEFRATVTLFTNDPGAERLKLEIAGVVESLVELQPSPAIFLSAFRWEAQQKEGKVLVVNRDETPLKILGMSAEGTAFTPRLAVVEEGQQYQIFVKLTPEAVAGKESGQITLRTEKETIQIPVYTFLKEKVYSNPTYVDFGRVDLEQVTANPGLLDFRKLSVFLYQHHGKQFEIRIESLPEFLALERTPAVGPGSVIEIPRQGPTAVFELALSLVRERLQKGVFDTAIRISTNDSEFPTLTIPVRLEVL